MKHFNPTLLLTLLLPPGVALVGCGTHEAAGTTQTTSAESIARRVDDTAVNAGDPHGPLTPMDQGKSPRDLKTTQDIRRALMANEALSFDAKNVKVITRDGTVTLRGPVKSTSERATVEAMAWEAAGLNDIDDRLEVEARR